MYNIMLIPNSKFKIENKIKTRNKNKIKQSLLFATLIIYCYYHFGRSYNKLFLYRGNYEKQFMQWFFYRDIDRNFLITNICIMFLL